MSLFAGYSSPRGFYSNRWKMYRAASNYIGWDSITGERQRNNTQASLSAQMDYEAYLRGANERALADWNKNVGSKGRSIKYPELSYSGQVRRADTSIARASFDYSTADANYHGNLPYRVAGLYGIAGRVSRSL